MKKPIIITMGDPCGVGPEILIRALAEGRFPAERRLVIAGDAGCLLRAADLIGVDASLEESGDLRIGEMRVGLAALSELAPKDMVYGKPTIAAGAATARYVEWACNQCLKGEAAAMVTNPLNKKIINAAGVHFPGHTELLAERCGVEKVVMMLAGPRLRVALVTTHHAYTEIPAILTTEEILATIRITHQAMQRDCALPAPRLAVLALNPHAGESGLFGDEEERVIAPAIAAARAEGIDATGPHSADTLFHFAVQGKYDAVICMYHDQGLIPLKLLHFADGVNLTLGLPIIRTSVDHGTAYDLAGTGRGDCTSLVAACTMAVEMADNREKR